MRQWGVVVAHIHSHPAGDVLSEDFSNGSINDKGLGGDEYIMDAIDEIDYYLLTPSGRLIGSVNGGMARTFLGRFDDNNKFYKGGELENVDDEDLLPIKMDEKDPLKPGQIKYPWNENKLPDDLKPEGSKPKGVGRNGRICIGCYIEPPPWVKRTYADKNKIE